MSSEYNILNKGNRVVFLPGHGDIYDFVLDGFFEDKPEKLFLIKDLSL